MSETQKKSEQYQQDFQINMNVNLSAQSQNKESSSLPKRNSHPGRLSKEKEKDRGIKKKLIQNQQWEIFWKKKKEYQDLKKYEKPTKYVKTCEQVTEHQQQKEENDSLVNVMKQLGE